MLHNRFKFALDLLEIALDPLALGLRQRLKQLGCKYLAVVSRRQRQSHWRAQHSNALRLGTPLQLAKTLLVASLELLVDNIPSRSVIVAFEGCRQGNAQFVD